jgi:hypothetical protein
MPTHPTSRKRNQRQKLKARYMKAREDAQLCGLIVTIKEGAVRDERVAPATQGEQALLALDRTAVCRGWATPDEKKPRVIDRLMAIVEDPASDPYEIIASARALMTGDQRQWERDNADLANNVNDGSEINTHFTHEQTMKLVEEIEAKIGRKIGLPPSMQQIEDANRVRPEDVIPPSE